MKEDEFYFWSKNFSFTTSKNFFYKVLK
jgi:hypothetical protein